MGSLRPFVRPTRCGLTSRFCSYSCLYQVIQATAIYNQEDADTTKAVEILSDFAEALGDNARPKRDADRGVTNLDIRDAILQLLNVIRDGNKKMTKFAEDDVDMGERILKSLNSQGGGGSGSFEKKIDNISTFLLRMYSKMDTIDRHIRQGNRRNGGGGSGGGSAALETLAQESFDILELLPTYIEGIKTSVNGLSQETKSNFAKVEYLLIDDSEESGSEGSGNRSLAKVLRSTESNILGASRELKDIVIESGHMAESLFERVNDGYTELTAEIKGLSNVEQVLLDTADSVMDTKKKLEFGVQQIIFKVGELVEVSGGQMDDQMADKFEDITRTILSNQTEALANLTKKVEKEIGQVWRQMGIMYGQVSNSIAILEKVKASTEGYVNNTSKNLGTMEGQVTGLTDRMVDVDSNLNYMLGQLSLVVQEFNQVKTGLGEAMNGLGDELEEITEFKPNNGSSTPE